MSSNESDSEHGGGKDEDFEEEKEEDVRIREALDWKRRHFFISSLCVSLVLMVKLEFSYSTIFGLHIYMFLTVFAFVDVIME